MLNQSIIPKDSLLNCWTHILSQTEVPFSYQLACGLGIIGALLKRQVWIDQHSTAGWGWNVYPNQSIMLIGPSGVGKDTAINFTLRFLKEASPSFPVLGGTTIENIYHRMVNLGKPAAAFLPVGEMAAFFGGRDYQSGMVQSITDILSSNESIDVSTKTDLINTGKKIIQQPTVTMISGSTEEWLHKAMPDGALEGGFLGRFLIMVEKFGRRQIPLTKYAISSPIEREELGEASRMWKEGVLEIVKQCSSPNWGNRTGEIILLEEAVEVYTNWYYNRFTYFSKAVMPYANRSRDMVLRLAMLMALSRRHYGWVDDIDIQFGCDVLREVGKSIDSVVLPPTTESQCAKAIKNALPLTDPEVIRTFATKYTIRTVQFALQQLKEGGEIERSGQKWIKKSTD